jgi:hypothetical protein
LVATATTLHAAARLGATANFGDGFKTTGCTESTTSDAGGCLTSLRGSGCAPRRRSGGGVEVSTATTGKLGLVFPAARKTAGWLGRLG